jgi:hypothetical protein
VAVPYFYVQSFTLSPLQAGDLATVKRIERALMTEEEREKARYK